MLDELLLAYAATIHMSQGSEYPAVVIPLTTQHYPMLQRYLVYNGVTRGKRLVMLVGQRKALAIAVKGGRVVGDRADAAGNWIAEHISAFDVCVTSDIPLAARCLKRGARVVSPTGKQWTQANIGNALAGREIARHLRELGTNTRGLAPLTKRDRSRFLSALDTAVQAALREAAPEPISSASFWRFFEPGAAVLVEPRRADLVKSTPRSYRDPSESLAHPVEQRLRLLEVGRVEALGEPAVDRGEQVAGFGMAALVAAEPGEDAQDGCGKAEGTAGLDDRC